MNQTPAYSRRTWMCRFAPGFLIPPTLVGQIRLAGGAAEPEGSGRPSDPFATFPLLGKLKTRPSAEIHSSPLSVGFEVLDRKLFQPEKTYPYLAELGVKWARCQTGWCRCEEQPGEFQFGWLDEVVESLRRIGIQPWFCLSYGNRLYTPEADDPAAVGWVPLFREEARSAWLRFTEAIARHFRDRVKHWEIWNEPNIAQFWKPRRPDPLDYVELVRLTAPVIRKAVPSAMIIGGAFAGMPTDFLRRCLEAGLGQFVDRISYHPYRPVPEAGYSEEVARFRQLLAQFAPEVRLWQGENGCPSQGGPESTGALADLRWDEFRQAKWLLRRMMIDLLLELELTSYFHTVDLVGYRGKTNFKGLLRGVDYSPKPAYFAYRHLCTLFDCESKLWPEAKLLCRPAARKSPNRGESSPGGAKGQSSSVDLAKVLRGVFCRQGSFLAVFWYPANLQADWSGELVDIEISFPAATSVSQPVLVDLLTGNIFGLDFRLEDGSSLLLTNVPLSDYPLVITERRLVAPAG